MAKGTLGYEEQIEGLRRGYLKEKDHEWLGMLEPFSSPLEKLFVATMMRQRWVFNITFDQSRELAELATHHGLLKDPRAAWPHNYQRWFYSADELVVCRSQPVLRVGKKTFRPDFAFVFRHPEPNISRVLVELDGHDFHDRTPEQAERDKSRDRALQLVGWIVLRFTGREVLRDPGRCLTEAVNPIYGSSGFEPEEFIE